MNPANPMIYLRDVFAEYPDHPAFASGDSSLTYAWLQSRIDGYLDVLRDNGIGTGDIVALLGDYDPEICALMLALIAADTVLVPFASVSGSEKEELAAIANVRHEIDFGPEGEPRIRSREGLGGELNPLTARFRQDRRPGLIVFTSGSTGAPKGILHDFCRIFEKFKRRRKTMKTLTFLHLDHLGGINTLLYILSNGGTVITIANRAPRAVCEAIERHRIELLPVTPSFLNLLVMSAEIEKHDLSSLKIISYGTEVMPKATLKKVRDLFPSVLLQQTYGLSELGVLRTKSRPDGSLWVKVGGEGFETRVKDGRLWIKAESAMIGYLNAPQPFDEDGWFDTGDWVDVDGDYVRIHGRHSEMINVGGQKVFPSEIENILIQVDNVEDAVAWGEKNAILGQIVAAKLRLRSPEEYASVTSRIHAFCKSRMASYKIPRKIQITSKALYSSRYKRERRQEEGSP